MIHQDHSQHVTVPVLCQLSHKPLFIFTRQEMRKKNATAALLNLDVSQMKHLDGN